MRSSHESKEPDDRTVTAGYEAPLWQTADARRDSMVVGVHVNFVRMQAT